MRKPQIAEVECIGKERFDDASRARRVASMSAHRGGKRMNSYKCGHCFGWHIGHSAPKAKATKSARLHINDDGDDFHA